MDVPAYLQEKARLVEAALEEYLLPADRFPPVIHQAMRYSVFSNGKRLRPVLALATAEMFGVAESAVLPVACAVELIHTYSLIHDDLPCMDNDDLRRGKPTCHRAFGEAVALLAGDALLTYAFELMAANALAVGISASTMLRVIAEIAYAAGTQGMIGGQIEDLRAEGQNVDIACVEYIHTHKTGALIKASVRAGALLGNASEEELARLSIYGEKLGLAFQIMDDILNITGDEAMLGKRVGSDAERKKATYPGLIGIDASAHLARGYINSAVEALAPFGDKAQVLIDLARFSVARNA